MSDHRPNTPAPTPKQTPTEPVIRPPVLASLAVVGTGVFIAGLVLALAAAGEELDTRSAVLGIVPALVPCLLPTAVFAVMGPQPASRFGYVVLGLAGARFFVSLSAMLAVWLTVEPQRAGFLLGFLAVAGGTLVAEKLVALLALRPAWAMPYDAHHRPEPQPS